MIVVTGATGKLGSHVVEQLLAQLAPTSLRLAVRTPAKAARWSAAGVDVVAADYDDPASLRKAFAGAQKLLLISASELGQRERQHGNIIGAAQEAQVDLIVYTSLLHADRSRLSLAAEHLATEAALKESGIDHTILRNGWYIENYTENLEGSIQGGQFIGSAGEGRIGAATRADFAAAAVAALTQPGHIGKIYELAGDEPFTMAQLAAVVSAQTGKTLPYNDLPPEEYRQTLLSFGVPEAMVTLLVSADQGIALGDLDDRSGDLSRLIGRPTTPLQDAVRAALAS